MLKFSITTLGCKVNQCEENIISESFILAGFIRAGNGDKANIYIINSCCITREAENKARHIASSIKKRYPDAITVLTGCYATRLKDETINNIDIYVPQTDKPYIVDICIKKAAGALTKINELDINKTKQKKNTVKIPIKNKIPNVRTAFKTRAQLKIQDGCKSFCSYCIVPYIRNTEYNMPPSEVLESLERLGKMGYSEVVLTGIHTGKYHSSDIDSKDFNFERLLKTINLYPFSTDFRIRISSIDPSELSESIIMLIKNSRLFVPHFHLALQSGSDKILRLMKRAYDKNLFIEKLKIIKQNIEFAAITSDVIVGFPSETQSDFEETFDILNHFDFYDFHIFKYCDRPGTAASSMTPKVSEKDKKERSIILHKLKKEKNNLYYKTNSGREAIVIAEKITFNSNGKAVLYGHTERYIEAAFEGTPDMLAKKIKVKLIEPAKNFDGMNAVII